MPYAAKAKIEHEFETDHLNVWVTFRHPMDQNLTPPLELWIVEADEVAVDIIASVWQDEFTLLLTSDSVGAAPERVTLAYSGPSGSLQTTWGKDWEPWGAILSIDLVACRKPSFVDRSDSVGWDFNTGDFVKDDSLHELDLSDIVPIGAVAVVFSIRVASPVANKLFGIQKNAAASGCSMSRLRTQRGSVVFCCNLIVPVDSSRVVSYFASAVTWSNIDVFVLGWFL